jgi:hypothetical protein
MSPEQALGEEIDFRSDIYSLAVVAYSLVCGALPFTGKTSELFEFHRTGSPAPPASVRKIPRDVSDAILAGLARNPADRPASAIRIHAAVSITRWTPNFSRCGDRKRSCCNISRPTLFCCLPIYTVILTMTGLLGRIQPETAAGCRFARGAGPAGGGDSLHFLRQPVLRAAAALMAMDEQPASGGSYRSASSGSWLERCRFWW